MDRIGRYEILGEIGRGGFGVVYRAHDPVMRRNVAVKVLTAVSDPTLLARFRSEAGTTGNLRHKNIITVYDYGEHDGQPFLVMELLEGRSLQEVIRDGPPLSLFEKVSVLLQVAEGLRFAHEQGVVHRDVKPSNVMLLNDGGARILDFGIARFLDASRTRHTMPGFILGTIEYMSPDQLQGVDAGPLTDIFSFGVTCYELLSGRQPFRADTIGRTMHLLAAADPAPLGQVVPGCPEDLQHVVRTALEKDRSLRYQSMQDLLFDLAPIEAALRKERALDLAAEAGRLIELGDFDHAQSSLNRVLELDPACEKGQALRREIQRRPERREPRQAEALAAAGEQQQSRAVAQRCAALLAEAREAARQGDFPAAHRLAAEAAALDPPSTEPAGLAQQLAAEEQTISSVTQAVRTHVDAQRYTEALRLVEGALGQYPANEVLRKVRDVVREARRRHAAELEAERQQAIERQRQAEEQLRLLETERSEEPPPPSLVGRTPPSWVPSGDDPLVAPPRSSPGPPPARPAVIPSPAAPYRRLGRWTMVLAAAALVALVLGFWLLPQRKQIEERKQPEPASLQHKTPIRTSSAPYPGMASEGAEGRKADLPAKNDSKREQDQQKALAQAEQLLQQGDYSAAIAWFQRVLASDPGSTRARNGLKQATDAKAAEDRVFGGGR
jgi:tetratricopeptide (TPR) repeat protein/predicted Ser/Thr protein kinase